MGIVTLKDLIDGVRDTLANWPVTGTLQAGISATDTTLVLNEAGVASFAGNKTVVEIDDEVILVTDETSGTLTIVRGYRGSTAAAHAINAEVKVHATWGWTDRVIRYDYIRKAILWLKPHAWSIGVSEPFTWAADTYDTQIASSSLVSYPHGNHILQLEYMDPSSGIYKPFYSWQSVGPYIRFSQKASQAHTLHAIYQHFQQPLTTLATPLDNDDFEEAIIMYASQLALNSLKSNRVRFSEYSASLNDRSSTPDELVRIAFDLKNQAILARDNASRPVPPSFSKTYRDPS